MLTTDHGARSRVGREEEIMRGEILVQILPSHRRLHYHVQIIFMEFQNLVHPTKIDAYPTPCRRKMPLQRRPSTVRCYGDASPMAHLHDLRHLLRARWAQYSKRLVGRQRRVGAPFAARMRLQILVVGRDVLFAHNLFKICPRGLQRCGRSVVVRRRRQRQRRRRCRASRLRSSAAQEPSAERTNSEYW